MTMELTGRHSPGHAILRVGTAAVLIGHLAISPLQVTAGVMPEGNVDPVPAHAASSTSWRGRPSTGR